MRILHLTLKKKWFDLIALGHKKIEYREVKPYWKTRLMKNGHFRNYDVIHFRNGYAKDAPTMVVEFKGVAVVNRMIHKPKNGEELLDDTFAIKLGKVLEIKNYT